MIAGGNVIFQQHPLKGVVAIVGIVAIAIVAIVLVFQPSRRQNDRIEALLSKVVTESKLQPGKDGNASRVDFTRLIKDWASKYGMSAEQAQAEVDKWVDDVLANRNDNSKTALAEFYRKNFREAEELFRKSAEDRLSEADALEQREQRIRQQAETLTAAAVDDLRHAGDSSYQNYDFQKSLEYYEKALSHVSRPKVLLAAKTYGSVFYDKWPPSIARGKW